MNAQYRFQLYFFPFILGILEWLIRTAMSNPDSNTFFSLAFSTAALTLVFPTIVPKPIAACPDSMPKISEGRTLRNINDEKLIAFALFFMFLGIALWVMCLYLSIGGEKRYPLHAWPWAEYPKYAISATLYSLAILFSELKEHT